MKFLKDEKGNVTILVAVVFLALMGMMALVVDMGVVFAEKVELINAIDAALLAGAQELPSDKTKARSVMETYLVENGVALEDVQITIATDGLSAEIVSTVTVPHYFAKMIGIESSEVTGNGKVILGPASSAKGGIRPFGVEKYNFIYGDEVALKVGGGDGYHGNYGALALGGNGACVLLNNALYGYDGELNIGDTVFTEPGNMAGMVNSLSYYINNIDETFDDFERDSDRVWTVPIFESMEVNGRTAVEVVGFAQFFIESAYKIQGKAEIHGRFIEYVTNGDIDPTLESTGVYGMKLVD